MIFTDLFAHLNGLKLIRYQSLASAWTGDTGHVEHSGNSDGLQYCRRNTVAVLHCSCLLYMLQYTCFCVYENVLRYFILKDL